MSNQSWKDKFGEITTDLISDFAGSLAKVVVEILITDNSLDLYGMKEAAPELFEYIVQEVFPLVKTKIETALSQINIIDFIVYLYRKVINIIGGSSLVIMVTDPMGHRIGGAQVSGTWVEVNEIPNALYSGVGSHPQKIVIPLPQEGKYIVTIIGNESGSYSLRVENYINGTLCLLDKFNNTIQKGEVQTINYVVREDTVRILPVVYGFNIPSKAEVGEKLQLSINVSKSELESVKVCFSDNKGNWHNYTAIWKEGVYTLSVDTSGFVIGDYTVHLSITDKGYVQTWTYPFILLGRLMVAGYLSKGDAIQGEKITVSLYIKDQDENPVNYANVSVLLAGKKYSAFSVGGGKYETLIDTSGLEGSYIIEVTADKEGYRQADYALAITVRPWWWPYLPYMALAAIILVVSLLVYSLKKKEGKEVIVMPPELLGEAKQLVEKGDYAEAVKHSAEELRYRLISSLNLSKSLTVEELVHKVAELRRDIDSDKLRYVLNLGDKCEFGKYRPSKSEAEKALKYTEEIIRNL